MKEVRFKIEIKNTPEELRNIHSDTAYQFAKMFELKYNLIFEGWVGFAVVEIAIFGDYFFSYRDIMIDVLDNYNNNVIMDWYDLMVENPENTPNFENYIKQKDIADYKKNRKYLKPKSTTQ